MKQLPVAAIAVRGLRAGYGASSILHGVDFDVAAGEFIAIQNNSPKIYSRLSSTVRGLNPFVRA